MTMQEYLIILRHNRQSVRIYYTAKDSDTAVNLVLQSEGAPFSALKGVYATNLTPDVSCKYGAPMGRRNSPGFGSNPDRSAYRARRIRFVDGAYDPGGAYWGARAAGWYLYGVQDGEGNVAYVNAKTSREAIATALGEESEA